MPSPPIGTDEELALINYLTRSTASSEEQQAADALVSRISEVERLRDQVEGCEAALVEAKAQLEYLDERHRKGSTVSTLACIDRALSQHRTTG